MNCKLSLVLLIALLLSLGTMASADDYYYLTAGDQSRMTIVDLNTQNWWQTSLSGNEYAIAVFPTGEVTVGAYQNNGAWYNLAGVYQYTVNNANTIPNSQWLDGTTNGKNNYTVDFYNGNVYQTDTNFNNANALFNVGNGYIFIGITYDSANGNLWLADRYGNPGRITEYTLSGTPLFSFNTGISFISALAYEASTNTLWVTNTNTCGSGTCLYEYDTSGNLLKTFNIPVYDNIIGGEISTIPEPGTLLLMGSGVLGLLGVVRRKMSI
jgi:sugar lactone lactonase YvrE